MKKLFFFCAALFALTAQAEEITLDLSTATDYNSTPIQFETKDIPVYNGNMTNVWDSTYAADWTATYIMVNEAKFMFAHAGYAAKPYYSWTGFTVSKVASDTLNQFACAAKGGIAGVGTPFLVSYGENTTMAFKNEYFPKEVQICQSAYTLTSMKNGDGFAKKFTKQDTLALTIVGYDNVQVPTDTVVYYLAVDGKFNEGWATVDLSSMDKCWGLNFHLSSTDCSTYDGVTYLNTPAYFALDGLTISTEKLGTGIQSVETSVKTTKRLVNGELLIEHNGNTYNAAGQLLK